jgi:hypothetical protein
MPVGTWLAHIWMFGAVSSIGPAGASRGTPGGSVCAENRLGAFGSMPVCGGGCPVARGLLLLHLRIIAPARCQSLVRGGQEVVSFSGSAEGIDAGGDRLLRGCL